ncbi:MmgE/PrpD family protein [Rhodococcus erythropolis]|uniref:MmgE/PrpD family protein n=1 Tax=Rhodococcus erythropolis TaxID=1833 RepID=UPI00210EA94C|nr:MmgE/PrpD family protein [Rhodococcus erythropolis]MCQ4129034.1 MmgE/PrpD family protein [Rhodococcus erythropolis]
MALEEETEALIAAEATALALESVPTDVIEAAVDCIIDALAVSIGASADETVGLAARVADAPGLCTRLNGGALVAPRTAAFVNGIAAHVLDFDDWLPSAGLHPTAPLLPAVLAQAEASGHSSSLHGGRLLTAYIAGFEVQARLGASVAPGHYQAGFHPTSSIGIFGAATGVAHLLGLEAGEIQHAWGLAATQAAGLRAAFGTMGKSVQVGRAAEAGLLSAQLSAAGITAPNAAFFGPRGFAATHGQEASANLARVPFAEKWYLREVLIKRHASCFGTHAAIDALLALRDDVDLGAVREVELVVPEILRTVCAISSVTTPLEGKFSLAFTAALALVRGSCQVSDFTAGSVLDPLLKSVADRVRITFDTTLQPQQTMVRVLLTDGTAQHHSADSLVLPTRHERRAIVRCKLHDLAGPLIGAERCGALLAAIEQLPTGGAVSDVTSLLRTN